MEAIQQPFTGEPAEKANGSHGITLTVLVLSVVCTTLWLRYPAEAGVWLYATNVELWLGTKLWGLLTSMLIHANWLYLAFNCYWLWHLGRVLEKEMTPLSYLTLIVVTTLLSSLAEFAVSGQTGIGMSGMVYGLFGHMLVRRRSRPAFLRVINTSTIALFFGWLVLCFALAYKHMMSVANMAHLGGLTAGVLTGFAADGRRFRKAVHVVLGLILIGSAVPLYWAPWHDNWHFACALRALQKNDSASALVSLEEYHLRQPQHTWTAFMAANLRIRRKDYAIARQILLRTRNCRYDVMCENSFAWLLATCPEDQVRNGRRAVEVAQQVCEYTDWKKADYLDTLAAAYAETGDFDQALKWSDKALELSSDANREALQKNNRSFQNRQPLREP